MTRLCGTGHDIRKLFVVSLAVAIGACSQAMVKQPRPDPGNPLPDGAESNSTAFRQKLSGGRPHTPYTRTRDADCFLCRDIQVTIEAIGDTHLIDVNNAPSPGVAVARLVNLHDSKKEKYYGLKPNAEAEYFLWVDRIQNTTKAQWTLLEVPIKDGPVLAAKPTPLDECHKRVAGQTAKPDADFAEYRPACNRAIASRIQGVNTASMLLIDRLAALIDQAAQAVGSDAPDQGGWIECGYGCCT